MSIENYITSDGIQGTRYIYTPEEIEAKKAEVEKAKQKYQDWLDKIKRLDSDI